MVQGGGRVGSIRNRESRLARYLEFLFYFDIMGVEGVGNSHVLLDEDSCQPLALALGSFCLGQKTCITSVYLRYKLRKVLKQDSDLSRSSRMCTRISYTPPSCYLPSSALHSHVLFYKNKHQRSTPVRELTGLSDWPSLISRMHTNCGAEILWNITAVHLQSIK